MVDGARICATVEEMGSEFDGGFVDQSLRVRDVIRHHFQINGASVIRELPPEQFCRHGYVLGKTAEARFGNEMYKILTSAALSIMLNRSLIIGQTRHILVLSQSFSLIKGKYPFADYITYSNATFTLKEVKHLWRQNGCVKKYRKRLVMRLDDFEKPTKSTTDAEAAQFFLKNVHPEMRAAAFELFGEQGNSAPGGNVFGELMMSLISPTKDVKEAVDWVLQETGDPDISVHMRMLMSKFQGLSLLQSGTTSVFYSLKIVGVGYKARAEEAWRFLYLKLGYSHEVELAVPPAVRVFCFKNNVVCCTGIDKQRVHQFAATVRSCKPPDLIRAKA
ncbi:unnamed protein product [Arabidopsis halleri]